MRTPWQRSKRRGDSTRAGASLSQESASSKAPPPGAWQSNALGGLPLPRPEAHLGLVARAERHFVAGADGTGRMEVVRDGAALCAPGPGETLLRGRTHRAAGIEARRGGAVREKRSKKRYVLATVGKLSARKFLINW